MFSITLLCMGKLKEKFYTAAAEEYSKRLRAFADFRIVELPEYRLPDKPERNADRAGACPRGGGHPQGHPEGRMALCADAGGQAALLGRAGLRAAQCKDRRQIGGLFSDRLVVRHRSIDQGDGRSEALDE